MLPGPIALASDLHLTGGLGLDITVPISLLCPRSYDNAFLSGWIEMCHFDHRLPQAPRLAPDVRDHEAQVSKQPAQVPAIQGTRQGKR